jgi:hypothetical protein
MLLTLILVSVASTPPFSVSLASSAQQTPSEPTGTPPPAAAETADKSSLMLTGCIARGEGDDQFILSDVKNGTYRITGTDVNPYLGERVQVSGTTQRLHIGGGLWPTPNIAAQAGAIDQVRAAVAPMPGGEAYGTGPARLPELRAKKLRAVEGSCP